MWLACSSLSPLTYTIPVDTPSLPTKMSPLYPHLDTLQQTLGSPYSRAQPQKKPNARGPTPYQARLELYPAYSIIDDSKNKAQKLSAEAAKEFEAASQKAQAKAGHIELYSGKYYAACTFGGMMACVSSPGPGQHAGSSPNVGLDPHGRHPLGSRQNPSPDRLEAVQG